MASHVKAHSTSAWMLTACGAWLVALGLYFIFVRPPLLPEDLRFMGVTSDQVRSSTPGLEAWLQRVFIVMGGFMTGCGVLTVYLARVAMPLRLRLPGTSWTIGLTGVSTVVVMSASNFLLHSDFRWVLLAPALLWLAGCVLYLAKR